MLSLHSLSLLLLSYLFEVFEVSKLVSRQYIFNPCTALQMKKRTVHVLNVRVMFQFFTADSTVSHDPYCMRSSLFLITTTSGESKVSVGVPWITDPIISIRIVLPFQWAWDWCCLAQHNSAQYMHTMWDWNNNMQVGPNDTTGRDPLLLIDCCS